MAGGFTTSGASRRARRSTPCRTRTATASCARFARWLPRFSRARDRRRSNHAGACSRTSSRIRSTPGIGARATLPATARPSHSLPSLRLIGSCGRGTCPIMSSTAAAPAGGAIHDERRSWQILIVLCLAVFMLLLDTTVVNVAQVKIKDSLGASLTQIQWILDSYILAYAVLLLSFGRLGDIYGRKKLFMLGMAIFTAASVLCGLSEWIGNQNRHFRCLSADLLPRAAGRGRRLHDAAVALAAHGQLPGREARRRAGHLGKRGRARRHRRPDRRRTHRDRLQLAMDLPHQSAGRARFALPGLSHRAGIDRSARQPQHRLDRRRPFRSRHLLSRLRLHRRQSAWLDQHR